MFAAGSVESGLHIGLLFAGESPGFGAQKLAGGEPRGLIKPAGEGGSPAKSGGFFGQNDKHGLRDILGVRRVLDAAQGHGIDEIEMTLDQFAEGSVRLAVGVFPKQETVVHVVHIGHFVIIGRRGMNWDNYFVHKKGSEPKHFTSRMYWG